MTLYPSLLPALSTDDATLDSVVCERDSADVINHKVCGQLAASASAPTPATAPAWPASKRHIKFQLPQIFFGFDLLPPFVPEANLSLGRSIRVFMPRRLYPGSIDQAASVLYGRHNLHSINDVVVAIILIFMIFHYHLPFGGAGAEAECSISHKIT